MEKGTCVHIVARIIGGEVQAGKACPDVSPRVRFLQRGLTAAAAAAAGDDERESWFRWREFLSHVRLATALRSLINVAAGRCVRRNELLSVEEGERGVSHTRLQLNKMRDKNEIERESE